MIIINELFFKKKTVFLLSPPQVAWIWAVFFAFLVPEMGTLFRAARIVVFKSARRCAPKDFLVVLVFETMHMVGMAMLVFVVFPELDVIKVREFLLALWVLSSMPLRMWGWSYGLL